MKSSKYNNKNHTTCLTSSTSTSFALLRYVALLCRWEFNLVLIGGIRFVVCGRLLLWSEPLPLPNPLMLLFEFVYYEYRGESKVVCLVARFISSLPFFAEQIFACGLCLFVTLVRFRRTAKVVWFFLPAKLYELQLFLLGFFFSWQNFLNRYSRSSNNNTSFKEL